MPTQEVQELVARIKPEGVEETTEQLERQQDTFEETAQTAEEESGKLDRFAAKWKGAMGAIVAGLAVGTAGLLSKVPVIGEAMSGLNAVIDALAFQLDQALRPVLGDVTSELFDLADEIHKADGVLEGLGKIGDAIEDLAGATVTIAVESDIVKAGTEDLIKFVFPELGEEDILTAVFKADIGNAVILSFIFGGAAIGTSKLLAWVFGASISASAILTFVFASVTGGAILSFLFDEVNMTQGAILSAIFAGMGMTANAVLVATFGGISMTAAGIIGFIFGGIALTGAMVLDALLGEKFNIEEDQVITALFLGLSITAGAIIAAVFGGVSITAAAIIGTLFGGVVITAGMILSEITPEAPEGGHQSPRSPVPPGGRDTSAGGSSRGPSPGSQMEAIQMRQEIGAVFEMFLDGRQIAEGTQKFSDDPTARRGTFD